MLADAYRVPGYIRRTDDLVALQKNIACGLSAPTVCLQSVFQIKIFETPCEGPLSYGYTCHVIAGCSWYLLLRKRRAGVLNDTGKRERLD